MIRKNDDDKFPNDDYSRFGDACYSERNYSQDEIKSLSSQDIKARWRIDKKVREEVDELLRNHPSLDATDISIEVRNSVVTLGGFVKTSEDLQLAEDIVRSLAIVDDVVNRLKTSLNTRGVLDRVTGNPDALNLVRVKK